MKYFTLILGLSIFMLVSCNRNPSQANEQAKENKEESGSDAQTEIANTVHGFFKWYAAFIEAPEGNFDFVSDDGKHPTLDNQKLDKHLQKFVASGFVSTQWTASERGFYNQCATKWKNQPADDLPEGMDSDRIICGQDANFEEFGTASVQAEIKGETAVATMAFPQGSGNGVNRKYDLLKENGKWRITKFHCEGEE